MLDDRDQRLADRLWERGQELLADQHWSWPEEVEEAAERLTNDPALARNAIWATQRAIAIGYALRNAEMQLVGVLTFDDDYVAGLAQWSIDEPCMAISAGAMSVRDALPSPFGPSAEVWDELQVRAITDTSQWAAAMPDAAAAPPDEVIGRSVALGYGLAYSYWAIQSLSAAPGHDEPEDTRTSTAPSVDSDRDAAWGLAGGQAQVTAEEFMSCFRLGRGEPMNESFPACLHLTYEASSRVDVLRMDWADREHILGLLVEQIVEHEAHAAALLIAERDSKSVGMMPCAFRILTVGCDGHLHESRARIKRSRHGLPEKLHRWKVLGVYVRASDCAFPDFALAMLEGFVRNGYGAQIPTVLFE